MTEAQTEAVTPKKHLVIETPRLDQMVEVAKKAVQNLKDRKELQLPDPEVQANVWTCAKTIQVQPS